MKTYFLRLLGSQSLVIVPEELIRKIRSKNLLQPNEPLWFPAKLIHLTKEHKHDVTNIKLGRNHYLNAVDYSYTTNECKFQLITWEEVPF